MASKSPENPTQLEALAQDIVDTAFIYAVSSNYFKEFVSMVNKSTRELGFFFATDDYRVYYIKRVNP